MTRLRIVVVLLALGLVLVGRWSVHTSAAANTMPRAWNVSMIGDSVVDVPRDDDVVVPKVDVRGNEVDDAIGDYRVDTKGDIYERHSPETEVTKLRPPVS